MRADFQAIASLMQCQKHPSAAGALQGDGGGTHDFSLKSTNIIFGHFLPPCIWFSI
jgi:hypothetical protein